MVAGMITAAFLLLAPSPATIPSAKSAATDQAVTCTAISVWDGDGPIQCREGWKVRLNGIAAREIDGSCRRGHPCPTPTGIAARDALVRLLGGPIGRRSDGHILIRPIVLRCTTTGTSYDRITAWCSTPAGRDLSCAMISGGWALRWDRYWHQHRCPTPR